MAGLTVDGSTLALWRGDAATNTLVDATGNYPLTKFGSITSESGLVGDAVRLNAPDEYFTNPGDTAVRDLFLDGTWTVEALIKLLPNGGPAPGGGCVFFAFEDPITLSWGALLRAFGLDALYVSGGPNTGGAGFVQVPHTTVPPTAQLAVPSDEWVYVGLSSRFLSPGNASITFYINGRSVSATNTPIGLANGLTAGALAIGAWWTSPGVLTSGGDFNHCLINEIRVSTIERTPLEFTTNWLNFNDEPSSVITPSLIISQGSIKGENRFALLETNISVQSLKDTFDGVVLDVLKWTDVSSGGGVISVDDDCIFQVPKTGGTASIRSIAAWQNLDVSASFTHDNDVDLLYPSVELIHLGLRARIDSTDHFDLEHIWDPTRGLVLRTSVTTDGVTTILSLDSVQASTRSLRLVRLGGRIQAYAGSKMLYDFHGWRTESVTIEMFSKCSSSPLILSTTISEFSPRVVVSFGQEVAPATTEVANRIIGSVPKTSLPGLVEVIAHGNLTSQTLGDVFQYIAPLQLTLAQSDTTSIVVSNDDTLRDTSISNSGLRL